MKKYLILIFVLISFFANAQEWHHPFGWRDAREFGIVNDSSADVTTGMRLMMASYGTQGGTAVFRRGRYLVSDSVIVPSSVNISGEGGTTYVPLLASQGTAFYFNSATKNFLVTKPSSPTLFTIANVFENFSVTNVSAGSTAGSAIYMYHTNASIIRNIEVQNFWDNITIRAGNGYFIEDCGLYGFIHTGITIGNNVNADEGDYVLSGLTIIGNPTSATQPYAGILWLGSGGLKLNSSKFNGGGGKSHEMKYGVAMTATDGSTSDIDINQCSFENYDSTAIYALFQSVIRHVIIGNCQMDGNLPKGPAINLKWSGAFNALNGEVTISNYLITDFNGVAGTTPAAMLIDNANRVSIGTGAINTTFYNPISVINSTNVNILPTSTGTANQLAYWGASNSMTGSANFIVDNTNKLINIGGGTPNTSALINATSTSGNATYYARSSSSIGVESFYLENNRGSFASYGGLFYGGSGLSGNSLLGHTQDDKLFVFADGANNLGLVEGTTGTQSLFLVTNSVDRVTISGTGNVGINGSASYNVTNISATGSYSATGTDYTIQFTGSTATLVYPTVNLVKGRHLNLVNNASGSITIPSTKSGNAATITTLTTGQRAQVEYDLANTTWILVSLN